VLFDSQRPRAWLPAFGLVVRPTRGTTLLREAVHIHLRVDLHKRNFRGFSVPNHYRVQLLVGYSDWILGLMVLRRGERGIESKVRDRTRNLFSSLAAMFRSPQVAPHFTFSAPNQQCTHLRVPHARLRTRGAALLPQYSQSISMFKFCVFQSASFCP
jgi:hypothetical protein